MKKIFFALTTVLFLLVLFRGRGVSLQAETEKIIAVSAVFKNEAKLDKKGNVLVGTPIEKSDFTFFVTNDKKKKRELKAEELPKIKMDPFTLGFDKKGTVRISISYEEEGGTEPPVKGEAVLQATNERLLKIEARWSAATSYLVGEEVKKGEVTVNAVYQVFDGKGGFTEQVRTIRHDEFTISPEVLQFDGMNTIVADYLGMKAPFQVKAHGIKGIHAEYSGDKTAVIGDKFDLKKLRVSLIYTNGIKKKLAVSEVTVSDTEVRFVGDNIFTVTYGTYTDRITVKGIAKAVEKIDAKYEGGDLPVGSPIDLTKITLTVTYNNKTKEKAISGFTVNPATVTKIGVNTITVTYMGKTDTINIKATEVMPSYIIAVYNGKEVIEGSQVDKAKISVTAYYPDGKNKQVSDFTLSPETVNTVGIQSVKVTYKTVSANIFIPVIAKMVESLEVNYTGGVLHQFDSLDRTKLIVTAVYNDKTKANVSDYLLLNSVAEKLGENIFTVQYAGKTKDFRVEAVARLILGRGTLTAEASDEKYNSTITAHIENQYVREDIKLEIEGVERSVIRPAVRRVNKTGKYVAFDISVDSFQFDENGYMIAETSIPEGFDPAKVAVFYTPDKKKVMVQLTGGLISPETFRFYVYKSGTYVIMEKEKSDIDKQEIREDEVRSPFLIASLPHKMKVKQTEKVRAFLLFTKANNDGFTYESDDENVIKISEAGVLTAKAEGTANITVTSKNGGYAKSYEVEVVR